MGRLSLRPKLAAQPAIPIVDRSNPLGQSLISVLWGGPGQQKDLLNPGISFTKTVVTSQATVDGIGLNHAVVGTDGLFSERNRLDNSIQQPPVTIAWFGSITPSASPTSSEIIFCVGGEGQYGGIGLRLSYGTLQGLFRKDDGGNCYAYEASTLNVPLRTVCLTVSATELKLYRNGKNTGSGTWTQSPITFGGTFARTRLFGGDANDATVGAAGTAYFGCVFNRVLTDAEISSFNENPWQIFQSVRRAPLLPPVPPMSPPSTIRGVITRRFTKTTQPQRALKINPVFADGASVLYSYAQPYGTLDGSGYESRAPANFGNLMGSGLHVYFMTELPAVKFSPGMGYSIVLGNGTRVYTNGKTGIVKDESMLIVFKAVAGSLTGVQALMGYFSNNSYTPTDYGRGIWLDSGVIKASGVAGTNGKFVSSGITVIPGNIYVIAANFSANGTLFINGIKVASGNMSDNFAGYSFAVGSGGGDSGAARWSASGEVALVYATQKALPDAALASLTSNPWQLFNADNKKIYAEAPYQAPAPLTGGMTQRRPVPTIQPTEPRQIDWGNSLTQGLKIAVLPGVMSNLVDGTPIYKSELYHPVTTSPRKGRMALVTGSMAFPIPVDANDPLARYDNPIMTAFIYGSQTSAANTNLGFSRPNGSDTTLATWGVGLHGGSVNGAYGVSCGTTFLPPGGAAGLTLLPHAVTMTGDGATLSLYLDGKLQEAKAYTPTTANYNTAPSFRRQVLFTAETASGSQNPMEAYLGLWWDRVLTPTEVAALSANPWQVFKSQTKKYWVQTTAGTVGAYNLPVTVADFPLTGTSTNLSYARKMTAGSGSYSETVQGTSFALTKKISALVGTFTETGVPTGLASGRKLVMSSGTFAETAGGSASFIKIRFFVAGTNAFTLTGNAANTAAGRHIVLGSNGFTVTSNTTAFKAARRTAYNTGSYALTPTTVNFGFTRKVNAIVGTYPLTGSASGFKAARTIVEGAGSFSMTGLSTGVKAGRKIASAIGTFSLTPAALNFGFTRKVNGTSGSFVVTSKTVVWTYARKLVALSGSFVVTAQSASLGTTSARQLSANVNSFTFSGNVAAFKASRNVSVAAGSLNYSGNANTLLLTRKVNGVVIGNYAMTFNSALLGFTRKFAVNAGSMSVASGTTSFKVARKLPAIVNALTESGNNVGFQAIRRIPTSVGNFAETGINTGVRPYKRLAATAANFNVNGVEIGMNGASTVKISGTFGIFGFTGNSANLKSSRRVVVNPDGLSMNGISAAVRPGRRVNTVSGIYPVTSNSTTLRATRKFAVTQSVLNINGNIIIIRAGRKMKATTDSIPITFKYVSVRVSGSIRNIFSNRFRNMFISL